MDYLRAEGLSLQLGQRDVLKRVSLTLKGGQRLGLVGRNGAGKTSLLRILAAALKPTEGVLNRSPGVRLSYVQQTPLTGEGTLLETAQTSLEHLRELEQNLRREEKKLAAGEGSLQHYAKLTTAFETAGGYQAETDLETLLLEFGFAVAQFSQPLETLSGGEGARLKLVMALAEKPDILLLDEPSNHLDLKLRRKLAAHLAKFPGALLLASHDRALLDVVCTHIGQLENGTLTRYRGNYSAFRTRQMQTQRSDLKQSKQRAKEIAHLQAAQARLRAWGTPKAQRQRRHIDRRLEKLDLTNKIPSDPKQASGSFALRAKQVRGTLLTAQHLSQSYDHKQVIDDATFTLAAGDKVALVGPNGSGKSTLLDLVSGELESDHPETEFYWHSQSKLAVFDQQNRGVGETETPLAQLERFVSRPRAELLLALVSVPQVLWKSLPDALSGGERARLGLALLIASEANVLLLDEPTNDLDIAMIETLESTLKDTDAAVLFTSHDERLIEKVATRVWSLEAGKLLEYRGGVEGYFAANLRLETIDPIVEEKVSAPVPKLSLDALELERLELEAQLLDPLLLSERELVRVKERYVEVLDSLSLAYDATFPEALPRYRYTRNGITVSTNGFEQARGLTAQFETSGGWSISLFRPEKSGVGHLRFVKSELFCSLPWARLTVLEIVTQLAFERLDVSALQLQTEDNLTPLGFKNAGNGWWVLSLSAYEARLGYAPLNKSKKRRKKRRKKAKRRANNTATEQAKLV